MAIQTMIINGVALLVLAFISVGAWIIIDNNVEIYENKKLLDKLSDVLGRDIVEVQDE